MKSLLSLKAVVLGMSPPSRGAWIEIRLPGPNLPSIMVAPLAGGVD